MISLVTITQFLVHMRIEEIMTVMFVSFECTCS